MKQYVIDELKLKDYHKIKKYLKKNYQELGIEGVFLLEIEKKILSSIQIKHEECIPFYLTLKLDKNLLCCELLVRSVNKISCICSKYASIRQRNWAISKIDSIIELLKIIV